MSKQKKETFAPLDGKGDSFDRFVLDYGSCLDGGELPPKISKELRESFSTQRKRLEERNISIKTRFESRFMAGERVKFGNWKDKKYSGSMRCKSVLLDREFFREKRKALHIKKRVLFYETETYLQAVSHAADELYNCPSCGAPIRIGDLSTKGCEYCSAKFTRAELFPLISNYYMVDDFSLVGESFKKIWFRWMLKTIPLVILVTIVVMLQETTGESGISISMLQSLPLLFQPENIIKLLALLIIEIPIATPLIAYLLWAVCTIVKVFWKAGESVATLWCLPGKKRFERMMKEIYPDYSYDYFMDKVSGILRMLIFSPEPDDCLYYEGEPLGDSLKNIVHSDFSGALGVSSAYFEGDMCCVWATSYLENVRDTGRKLLKQREKFTVLLCKDTSKGIDLGFSPHKIRCSGCGGSFDAVSDRDCPYCGKRYVNDYTDWTVRKIQIKKQSPLTGFLGFLLPPLVLAFAPLIIPALIIYALIPSNRKR